MTQISRRALLRTTYLYPVALAAAGCSSIASVVAIAPTIAGYIKTIAAVAQVVGPVILGLTNLGTNVKTTLATALTDIESVASDVSTATSTTATGLVQKLSSGVGTLAGLLSGFSGIPAKVGAFVTNAVALLPAIETAVGITPAPAAHAFAAAGISPEQAHANLQAILAAR